MARVAVSIGLVINNRLLHQAVANIQIIVYSTFGHLYGFAKQVQRGVEEAGGTADLFRVPETMSEEVLEKVKASAPDEEFQIASVETLRHYDAFLFGVPTRFGTLPAQWFDFWGTTGALWAKGALYGKPAGIFVSTSTPGGGQEVTIRNYLSILAHHGMIYVPLGYGGAFAQITSNEQVHGGSPWGAGLFAGSDGKRNATELENEIARVQGSEFYRVVNTTYDFANVDPDAANPTEKENEQIVADAAAIASNTANTNAVTAISTNIHIPSYKKKPTSDSNTSLDDTLTLAKEARQSQSRKVLLSEGPDPMGCAKCIIM